MLDFFEEISWCWIIVSQVILSRKEQRSSWLIGIAVQDSYILSFSQY